MIGHDFEAIEYLVNEAENTFEEYFEGRFYTTFLYLWNDRTFAVEIRSGNMKEGVIDCYVLYWNDHARWKTLDQITGEEIDTNSTS